MSKKYTSKDIITLPNPHLRQKAEKVHVITDDILETIEQMKEASLDWEKSHPHEISAALAAPQIDQPYKIVIIRDSFEDKNIQEFTALINPEIIKAEGTMVEDYEGCLSVPSVYGMVPRHSKVRVKALLENGKEVRLKATDSLARTLQHEIDHINGVLFIDHIKNKKDAFFELDENGELQPLDYDKDIKSNSLLWD
ncbi:MAG: peptide deformylase [Candidatus Nomurabacteria bacterium]|jgi:peptide deformylase|nr:peptide deformylase [Candidatus Nomurabacteria bacterium]